MRNSLRREIAIEARRAYPLKEEERTMETRQDGASAKEPRKWIIWPELDQGPETPEEWEARKTHAPLIQIDGAVLVYEVVQESQPSTTPIQVGVHCSPDADPKTVEALGHAIAGAIQRAQEIKAAAQPPADPSQGMQEAVDKLNSILVRCREGDKRADWLPIIAGLAEQALAALSRSQEAPAVAWKPWQDLLLDVAKYIQSKEDTRKFAEVTEGHRLYSRVLERIAYLAERAPAKEGGDRG